MRKKFDHIQKREVCDNGLAEREYKRVGNMQCTGVSKKHRQPFNWQKNHLMIGEIPLNQVFLEFTQISEGYGQNDMADKQFEHQRRQLISMQESEWLLFLREFEIVPGMMTPEKSSYFSLYQCS